MSAHRHATSPRRFLRFATVAGCAALLSAAGAASAQERVFANPPVAKKNASGLYDLGVVMKTGKIYDPESGQDDTVNLRNYVMTTDGSSNNVVGPTIIAKPGEKLEVMFQNRLVGKQCHHEPDRHNTPNCFNVTNLHTHGLWVTPKEPGDNVLIEFQPQSPPYHFIFDIPSEHPAGTFWYHAHRHGATALQLASGMGGALIVYGSRDPTLTETGDIDTLLINAAVTERVMVFQQISYACGPNENNPPVWECTGKTGTIDNYKQIGFGAWAGSGRYNSINGQVLPTIVTRAGQTERWRMIHAGVGDSLTVTIREKAASAPSPDRLSEAAEAEYTRANCNGPVVHQFAVAADGLTRSAIINRGADKPTTLQPGYREDVLVTFPHAGEYCVLDGDDPATASISQFAEPANILAMVRVGEGTNVDDQEQYLLKRLTDAAGRAYGTPVASKVRGELNSTAGMLLTSFVSHQSLMNETNVGRQELAFDNENGFTIATKLDNSNAKLYQPHIVDRYLKLGTTDEWELTSYGGGHPYHIHVNPFQIVKILNEQGVDVSETGEPGEGDMQYADLKNQWKDTIFVKDGYHIFFRTHYARFDGEFVLHCHILDHEDKGMMENVSIVLGGGNMAHHPRHKKKMKM